MESVECLVIGAGVVGLAVARALARTGREVVVVERSEQIGTETSSRNSEVIHAGIYYPAGSWKARLCVLGKQLLYAYCDEHEVDYRRCGKLIVAAEQSQLPVLAAYQRQAIDNGAGPLEWWDANRLHSEEPAVRGIAGVLSPSTGIVDSHGLMLSLRGQLEDCRGMIAFGSEVLKLTPVRNGVRVSLADIELRALQVVNSAGLRACALARQVDPHAPNAYFARGRYYGYSAPPPFRRLIYPVAEAGGLGVHVTLDLAGHARFGPDVEWIDSVDYGFDDSARDSFADAIRRYFPDLDEQRLHPDYTGVRPKIVPKGAPAADFRIDGPDEHGVAGLVNLLGIESPGLTAALAIARRVLVILGHAEP